MRLRRLAWAVGLATLLGACGACGKEPPGTTAADAGVPDDAAVAAQIQAVERAEDMRRSGDVSAEARTSHDVRIRRRAARALARIADDASLPGLLRALDDEDPATVAWGAYGLGFACKGHEDAHARALVARAASLEADAPGEAGVVDARWALARAVGKCGGPLAESTLAAWVRARGTWAEPAAYALGDVAGKRGTLDDDTVTALLDAAGDGMRAALYPFARVARLNDAFADRLLLTAKKALGGPPGEDRVFAVRALSRAGDAAAPELARVAQDKAFDPAERTEAARALARLGDAGHAAAAGALARLLPDRDPFAIMAMTGDVYSVFLGLVGSVGDLPPKSATPALQSLSALRAPGTAPAPLERRLGELRCEAASLLAQGSYDAEVLRKCAAAGTPAFERARLASVLRRPLVGARRKAWRALTGSAHLRVREDAIAAIARHPELRDAAVAPLAAALTDAHPGVVAVASDVVFAHPDRVMVLSEKEKRNALDPRAPPPTANPEMELAPAVAKALAGALAHPWTEDLVETRVGVLDAATAVHAKGAKAAALAACKDPNVTVRDHAQKALRALGEKDPKCPAPATMPLAPEAAAPHGGKITLITDAGTLGITLDPDLAPVTSTRLLSLAKAGFYKGIVVHRVVPGFVVQLGDPAGDGYGGSGKLLRCETSPVPFGPLDVGVALAGRDTGSSQIFVALARFPHLDGDYARVGHAEGDWWAVAEGDVIQQVRVTE